MKRILPFVIALAAIRLLAEPSPPDLFSYDAKAPLPIAVKATETRGGVVIQDLVIQPQGEPVKAFLVRPEKGEGPFAAILYVHWLGEPDTSNRTQFLDEAIELGARGVVSLLVDTPWSAPRWYRERVPEADFDNSVKQVVTQRREMDLLLQQPGIDKSRVAVVAHDFGAMYSLLAEGSERRATRYVFMAATPHFADWFLFARQPLDPEAYRRKMEVLDPIRYIGRLAPAPLLFQFADKDEYVSAEVAKAFADAAGAGKDIRHYAAGHDLHVPEARADRVAWLIRELKLP